MGVYPPVVTFEIMALHGYFTDSLKLKCPVESWNNVRTVGSPKERVHPAKFLLLHVHNMELTISTP